jgi:hypothetical protein
MSIPPPGYETPQASPSPPPPAPQRAPLSHEDAEAQTGSRQADDNMQYEFKSVLRTELNLALVASGALILVAGSIGIVAGAQSGGDSPKPSAAQTTASTAPPAQTTVTDITVDDLVDKLNSAGMGGMKVGDQFRVTGELVGSDHWMTGASGDFFVMLKTKEGADLEVFVDESDANGWQDGTKVEMVLKMVEVTIDGETMDGFFEAQSAKTISEGTT